MPPLTQAPIVTFANALLDHACSVGRVSKEKIINDLAMIQTHYEELKHIDIAAMDDYERVHEQPRIERENQLTENAALRAQHYNEWKTNNTKSALLAYIDLMPKLNAAFNPSQQIYTRYV